MNAFLISPMVVERLGWVLVHSLWQFAAIALVGFLLDRLLTRRSSAIRYVALLCGLTLMVAAPVVTWAVVPDSLDTNPSADLLIVEVDRSTMIDQRFSSDAHGRIEALPALAPSVGSSAPGRTTADFEMTAVVAADTAAETEMFADRLARLVAPWLGVVVGVWCCGVVMFSIRPVWGWFNVQRLKTVGVSPVADSVQQALKRIEQKLQIRRRVQLLQSSLVHVPVVVGCFQSVILLPASFISGVPVSQLEAILAHELAHVRRYDYLVNLMQTLVETLFFYHPAVWWVSRRIRIERENCCDDLVVAVFGNKVEYGRALLAVEEFRGAAASTLALSAKGGSLLARVKRLFVDPAQDDRSSVGLAALGILLAMITATGVWASVNAGVDESPNDDTDDAVGFVAKVTDEISVELLAVLPHKADSSQPWKPNGRPFQTPPELPDLLDSSNQYRDAYRHLFVRFHGIDGAGVTYAIPGLEAWLHPDENGLAHVIVQQTEDEAAPSLQVILTDADWGPWMKVDKHGKPMEKIAINSAYREVYDLIKPDHVRERPNSCHFCWSGLSGSDKRCEFSLVAVDNDGKRREAEGRTLWDLEQKSFVAEVFHLPIESIDHFEYRLRPYRHWVTFENVSLKAGQKTDVKITTVSLPIPEENDAAFGPESHGLQFRLVALSPDVNDNAPDLNAATNEWTRPADMTFGVELKNVSKETLTLAGIRYGGNFAEEVQGMLRTEMIAPHWFEFEFTDVDGKPIPRTRREYYHQWSVLDSASTHELASGQSLIEVLRPGKFNAPMDFDLPPGKYQVRVRYHGPDDEFRENVRQYWPDTAILNAWPHDIVSNSIQFEVNESSRRTKPEDLIWGQPVDGLQAALEYRLAGDVTGNPLEAPGIPVGTSIGVVFHLKNVSDKPISFISETGRQGDYVYVANERGEKVDVPSVFFSGWPIDVAWKLEPGEIAQLSLLTPGLGSLDQAGKYTVRYTVRFNSRQQKDDAGNVIFPRPGDYDKDVDTGDTPLFLQAVKRDVAANGEIHGRLFGDEMIVLDRKPGRTKTTDSDSDDERPGDDDGGAAPGQQEFSNAWRQFYTAQSDNGTFFIRNAYIDLIGRAATDDDVKQFINDSERDRREKLIDRLLASDSFWPFQESLIEENRRNKSGENLAAFPARILRGPQARLRADLAQTLFGEPKDGLQVGIRLRSNGLVRFKNGERVPLEILIRNAGTETITRDFSFDFIANVPDVFDEQGNSIPIEAFHLRGGIPLYKETLRPGDVFIYPNHGLGIGPNPNPGTNWNPHTPVLSPGKYKLSQVLSYGTSGSIEFEVLEPDKTPEAENDEDQATRPQAVLKPAAPEIKLPDFLNVMAVGFSDDSKTMWSVSTKSDVRFRAWDVATQQKTHEVKLDSDKHGNFFLSSELKLSPDRARVVGIFESKICLWDSTTGELVKALALPPEHQHSMLKGLSFSADFSRIACGLTSGFGGGRSLHSYAVVWNVASGDVLQTVELTGAVQTHCTALSADGRWLAAGGQQAGLRIWEVATGQLVHSIANSNPDIQHPDPEVNAPGTDQVLSLGFSPDGKLLAMADLLTVKVFETDSGELQHAINRSFRYGKSGLVFSPDGQLLARVDTDKQVPIWSTESGELVAEFPTEAHDGSFSPDGQWFAACFSDGEEGIGLWRLRSVARPKPNAQDDQAQLPWRVHGRVVDADGKPLEGVTVRAATGTGTLKGGGRGVTDADGRYDFRFGRGVIISRGEDGKPSPQTQSALISARLEGHFERNFSRHGNGIASLEPVAADVLKDWGLEPDQVCLPDKPREVNFVMMPAAKVSGTLVGEDDKPLKDYSVSLTGETLPPGSFVLAQVRTDETGRFEITEIPTTIPYQFEIRKPRSELKPPWDDSWASGPMTFVDPGDNDLSATFVATEPNEVSSAVIRTLKLKIVGPGVHGKKAVADAARRKPLTNSIPHPTPSEGLKLQAAEFTLILSNDNKVAEGRKPSGESTSDPSSTSNWNAVRPDSIAVETAESGEILDDDSVQMSLPGPNWSAPILKFKFAKAVKLNALRLELLPDTRFNDRHLGRIPGRELKLFEVKPGIISADGKARHFDWSNAEYIQDPDDAEVASLIDYATDTGWKVPDLAEGQAAHEFVFRLDEPISVTAGDTLAVEIDSGGSEELDTLARFRVSFPPP